MSINAQGICRSVVGAFLLECLPSQPATVLAIDESMEAFDSLMSLYIVAIGGIGVKYATYHKDMTGGVSGI